MRSERTAQRFFMVLLVLSTLLLAAVIRPLASGLFTAAVLAGVLHPLQLRLRRRLGERPQLAASLLVVGVIVVILGPLTGLSAFVVREGSQGIAYVSSTIRSEGVTGLLERMPAPARRVTQTLLDRLPREPGANLDETLVRQVNAQSSKAAAAVGSAVAATGELLFQATMMLIGLYFLLLQGEQLLAWLDSVSPLRPGQTHELLLEFKRVSYAVIVSTVITAGIQASAALLGYLIARVPHPFFFAALTFFIAFIPAVGAASVCEVAALLLFMTGHRYAALFLALWGFLVVALVDNLAKPWLIKSDVDMPMAVVFFALLGGLGAFGTVGLILGPLVVSLFVALLRMYRRDFARAESTALAE